MKYRVPALALLGALALTTAASAQIVNGGATPTAEAPVGTKGGGGSSTMQAPGEGPAVAGAVKNNAEANNMGTMSSKTMRRHKKTSNNTMTPATGN
jgi:hypothetical protein